MDGALNLAVCSARGRWDCAKPGRRGVLTIPHVTPDAAARPRVLRAVLGGGSRLPPDRGRFLRVVDAKTMTRVGLDEAVIGWSFLVFLPDALSGRWELTTGAASTRHYGFDAYGLVVLLDDDAGGPEHQGRPRRLGRHGRPDPSPGRMPACAVALKVLLGMEADGAVELARRPGLSERGIGAVSVCARRPGPVRRVVRNRPPALIAIGFSLFPYAGGIAAGGNVSSTTPANGRLGGSWRQSTPVGRGLPAGEGPRTRRRLSERGTRAQVDACVPSDPDELCCRLNASLEPQADGRSAAFGHEPHGQARAGRGRSSWHRRNC